MKVMIEFLTRLRCSLLGSLFVFFTSMTLADQANVTILKLDWSSQKVLSHVLYSLLTEQGVSAQILEVPASGQWFYLATAKADIQVEVWEGTMGKEFDKLLKQGRVSIGATHKVKSREGWWYPLFVEKLCPGLPDWKALLHCPYLLSGEEKRGVYFSGPWEKPDAARVRALNLPFDIRPMASGDDLNRVLLDAIEDERPILLFNWSPNWVDKAIKGRFINFPKYEAQCETEPLWGMNPKYPWDCDNPIDGWLKTAVSSRLKQKSLCAFKITESFILTNDDVALASYFVDSEGLSVEEAAQEWLKSNRSRYTDWLAHAECY